MKLRGWRERESRDGEKKRKRELGDERRWRSEGRMGEVDTYFPILFFVFFVFTC